MSIPVIIWLAIAAIVTIPIGRDIYREGFSDGWIKPHNLRGTIVTTPVFAVCWPILACMFGIGMFCEWVARGNK